MTTSPRILDLFVDRSGPRDLHREAGRRLLELDPTEQRRAGHRLRGAALLNTLGPTMPCSTTAAVRAREGSGVRVYTARNPLGPYTSQKRNVNRDAKRKTIIRAQQTFVAKVPPRTG